ncbi:hypothetical protein [Blastopirellula marina]|uniref:Uncharacterized protein n=1 Tax=Blastopirellula marina DSM 3645 TaxID=314230 RepID=A3ZUX7_9BACT|nr:hypothetical protein [Blastopirellula marina]EAQ79713.1 hypothetical protein DSM3645_24430 [Blastopirellula marina DSM 3645]
MSSATLAKRSTKKSGPKKAKTDPAPAKLSPPIEQLWYADEMLCSDGRFFRRYHYFSHTDKIGKMFDLPNNARVLLGNGSVSQETLACDPPAAAIIFADITISKWLWASIQISSFYATRKEAEADLDDDGTKFRSKTEHYFVVDVDRNGMPLQSEVDRLRPIVLEKIEAETKRTAKLEKDRARRDSARAKKAAATRRKNRQAVKGGA